MPKPTGRPTGRPVSIPDDEITELDGRKWRLTKDGSLFAQRTKGLSPRGRPLWIRFPASTDTNKKRIEEIKRIRNL